MYTVCLPTPKPRVTRGVIQASSDLFGFCWAFKREQQRSQLLHLHSWNLVFNVETDIK